MKTRSKLLLAALALATLSTNADAYPRWGHWNPHQHWSTRVPTRSTGSIVIRNLIGNGPCGLNMHMGSGGNCYIN